MESAIDWTFPAEAALYPMFASITGNDGLAKISGIHGKLFRLSATGTEESAAMGNQAKAVLVNKIYGVLPLAQPLRYVFRRFMARTGANGGNTR